MGLIQPIEGAINWFLALFLALPAPIRAFFGLSVTLFAVSSIILFLRHIKT